MDNECNRRQTKRHATALRLQRCAVELTVQHGFDGWTIDELAAAADVSRRTVFNYFDSKQDVVLGPDHELDETTRQQFIAGGPTGDLVDDIVTLAAGAMRDQTADLELVQLTRRVILSDPHLVAIVHRRFEAKLEHAVEQILAREGAEYGAARAALLMRLLVTAFDHAIAQLDPENPMPLEKALATAIADARGVLNP